MDTVTFQHGRRKTYYCFILLIFVAKLSCNNKYSACTHIPNTENSIFIENRNTNR